MNELLQLARDALLFKHEAYVQHVARADALKRGLTLLVVVTLLAGVISLVVNIVNGMRPADVEANLEEFQASVESFLQNARPYLDLPPDFEEGFREGLKAVRPGIEIGENIAALPTPLPKSIGVVLTNLGILLSSPFNRLAGWAGYGIWVLLAAKLLGGRATAAQTLGATALYAVPHVLDILGPVPCLGALLGLVATVWGIAIYVKGLAVANEFTIGRAIITTLLPALVIAALSVLGLLTLLIVGLAAG